MKAKTKQKISSVEGLVSLLIDDLIKNACGSNNLVLQWGINRIQREYKYVSNYHHLDINKLPKSAGGYHGQVSDAIVELASKVSKEETLKLLKNDEKLKAFIANELLEHISNKFANNVRATAKNIVRNNASLEKTLKQRIDQLIKAKKTVIEKDIIEDTLKEKLSKEELQSLQKAYGIKIQ